MTARNYPDTKPLPEPIEIPIDIVFRGSGPDLRFVEAETTFGHVGVSLGEWWTDDDGYQRLTIMPGHAVARLLHELEDKYETFSLHFDRQTDPYSTTWAVELPDEDNLYGGFDPAGALGFALERATSDEEE